MKKQIAAAIGFGIALLTTGCVTVHKDMTDLDKMNADSVLLVGRIELVPALAANEQHLDIGLDPFGTRDYFAGRAILYLSDKPIYEDWTSNAINPSLEQTWFVAVPRSQRYMVRGSVTMAYNKRTGGQTELLIPAPIEFDMKSGDKAIYIGTLRLHRDEFHEVTKAEIIDQYPKALAEYRAKFGADAPLRKAPARPVRKNVALTRE